MITKDVNQNALLSRCYSRIYKDMKYPWGLQPNSDMQLLIPEPFGRILDFGCGYGKNISHLIRDDTYVVGVDLCKTCLETALIRYKKDINSQRLSLLFGDESQKLRGFDLIICSGVIVDHLYYRRMKIADWIMRILNPGGFLFLTVFGQKDSAYGYGTELEKNTFLHQLGWPVHYFSREELCNMFEPLEINFLYSKIKQDLYPELHKHETLILFAKKPI